MLHRHWIRRRPYFCLYFDCVKFNKFLLPYSKIWFLLPLYHLQICHVYLLNLINYLKSYKILWSTIFLILTFSFKSPTCVWTKFIHAQQFWNSNTSFIKKDREEKKKRHAMDDWNGDDDRSEEVDLCSSHSFN